MEVIICEEPQIHRFADPGSYHFIVPSDESTQPNDWQYVRLQIYENGSFGRMSMNFGHIHARGRMRQALQCAKNANINKLTIIMCHRYVPEMSPLLLNVLGSDTIVTHGHVPIVPAALFESIQSTHRAA